MSEEKKQEYIAENADAEADTIFGGAPAPEPANAKSGTSKNTKLLIAGICVLVLLGGGLTASLLLNKDTGDTESTLDSSEAETILLNNNPAEDLTTLDVVNPDGAFTVTRELDADETAVYGVVGLEDITMDAGMLSTLVSNGSKLEAASLVEENASDLAKYGLAEPAAEVAMHYADGTTFTFRVGDIAPMAASQTYCEMDGNVYLVRNSLVANYKKSIDRFISMNILEEPEKSVYPIVESLRIERKDLDYDIFMEYDHEGAEDDSVGGTAATHIMTEPVFAYLDIVHSVDITNGMFGLSASDIPVIHPEEADLKKAGLDDPFCTVTMSCDDGNTYRLLLGDTYETESGVTCYYAKFANAPLLYGISEENALWATVLPGDITSANVFATYVWNIGKLEITAGDQVYLFEGEGIKQEDYVVTKNGEECDNERFRQLYTFLLNVYGEELYMGDVPTGKPDVSVHLTTQNGKEDYTVSFYRQSGVKTVIVRDNACYSIRTSAMDALLHNLDIFDDPDTAFQTTWQ